MPDLVGTSSKLIALLINGGNIKHRYGPEHFERCDVEGKGANVACNGNVRIHPKQIDWKIVSFSILNTDNFSPEKPERQKSWSMILESNKKVPYVLH